MKCPRPIVGLFLVVSCAAAAAVQRPNTTTTAKTLGSGDDTAFNWAVLSCVVVTAVAVCLFLALNASLAWYCLTGVNTQAQTDTELVYCEVARSWTRPTRNFRCLHE
jgi:hypothetical protein